MSEVLGIYGGTFSPPHKGHIHAARVFLDAVRPDKMLIIPAFIPPHKAYYADAMPEDRLEMCRLAFVDFPATEVSDVEIRRGGKSYTADTLAELSSPGRRLALLVGTDMMLTLSEWHASGEIFSLADIYCVRRESDAVTEERMWDMNRFYLQRYGKCVTVLPSAAQEVSSTDLRRELSVGEIDAKKLTPAVAAYIREKGLYSQ